MRRIVKIVLALPFFAKELKWEGNYMDSINVPFFHLMEKVLLMNQV